MNIPDTNAQITGLAYALKESISGYKTTTGPASGDAIIHELILESCQHNPWFIAEHVVYALESLANDLLKIADAEHALPGGGDISMPGDSPGGSDKSMPGDRTIGFLFRSAAPLEGLAELFYLIKHRCTCEVMLSREHEYMVKKFLLFLESFPGLSGNVKVNNVKLSNFSGLISMSELGTTTKDYFSKYKTLQLYQKGNSIILHGNEDESLLHKTAEMVCMYFGRSAQNVKVLFVPDEYDIDLLTPALEVYADQLYHNRYYNNFEYRKSAMIINHIPYKERGSLLITESASQAGYTGVLCIQRYSQAGDIMKNELSALYKPVNPVNELNFQSDQLSLSTYTHNHEKITNFLQSTGN